MLIIVFYYFCIPERGIFYFFQDNHTKNYEPDDHMQPIYSTGKKSTKGDQ
ncbi:hypothetical protein SAMN02787073_3799 [Chryseobacterium vrystaatense]|uniref:Uncharacterized protein n=1 Tax=Chryseobacterium vrystaatense TaxID=307480 RepID=A0A1M5IAT6_9FLAO|nr:hypothetical protein SAMN02787073_3799 [Chryseobacterium vrystaatense]